MDTSNNLEGLYFIAPSTKLTFMSTKTSEALLLNELTHELSIV